MQTLNKSCIISWTLISENKLPLLSKVSHNNNQYWTKVSLICHIIPHYDSEVKQAIRSYDYENI